MDPLLSTSLAPSLALVFYQWLFVIISCGVIVVLSVVNEKIRQSDRSYHAMRVYECFQSLINNGCLQQTTAICNWCANMDEGGGASHHLGRKALFCILLIFLVIVCSIPAAVFVLSR